MPSCVYINLHPHKQTHKADHAPCFYFLCKGLILLLFSSLFIFSQACIDDNVDMVTFLVEHGASINQPDNEGWIPLHAAASCGYLDIAE